MSRYWSPNSLTATERLGQLPTAPKVVVLLTTFDLDEYVHTALRAGAVGFLLKDAAASDMLAAVRSAANGDAMLSPKVTRRLLDRFTDPGSGRRVEAGRRLQVFTDKEREVLLAVARGMANTDIAANLYLSEPR